MPRIARMYSELKVYHIIIRGIDKQDIFLDTYDKDKFLKIIGDTKEKYNYEVYAYCLMDNHVHLIIYDKDEKISKIKQSIEIRYVSYFNLKYDRVGHLFQDRFHSKRIGDREYLKLACRYIHQNPAKAGIAKTEEYKWSSYKEYIKTPEIINNKLLLLVFSKDEKVAKQEFIRFHNVNANEDKKTEITNILEYELNVKFTDDEIRKYICDLLEIKNVHDISKYNAKMRKEQLLKIKCLKKVSISQLARVLGINRKIIERTLKNVQKEPSLLDTLDTKRR